MAEPGLGRARGQRAVLLTKGIAIHKCDYLLDGRCAGLTLARRVLAVVRCGKKLLTMK